MIDPPLHAEHRLNAEAARQLLLRFAAVCRVSVELAPGIFFGKDISDGLRIMDFGGRRGNIEDELVHRIREYVHLVAVEGFVVLLRPRGVNVLMPALVLVFLARPDLRFDLP